MKPNSHPSYPAPTGGPPKLPVADADLPARTPQPIASPHEVPDDDFDEPSPCDDSTWDAFIPDDDELDPLPEACDFWDEIPYDD